MKEVGVILGGLSVLLIGVAWLVQKSVVNGFLFLVLLFGFLSSVTSSYLSLIFGALSVISAVALLIIVGRKKKS